jgi:hypothetical protein
MTLASDGIRFTAEDADAVPDTGALELSVRGRIRANAKNCATRVRLVSRERDA